MGIEFEEAEVPQIIYAAASRALSAIQAAPEKVLEDEEAQKSEKMQDPATRPN